MATDLGKITITMHGEYDSSVAYERLSCVRYYRSTWVSKQATQGNTPSDDSEYWQKIADDGNTMTIVRYNAVIPEDLWQPSTAYEEYEYEASFSVEGVTASSICQVLFDLDSLTSNNFAPVCNSYYGGITIYAKKKPNTAIKIPSILANKYYNIDEVLSESAQESISVDVSNLGAQLGDITTSIIDVQRSTKFITDVLVPKSRWKARDTSLSGATKNSFNYYAEIPLEDLKSMYHMTLGADEHLSDYSATVLYDEVSASSMLYSPIVETKEKGMTTGYTNQEVIVLYGKQGAKESEITIPLIKLEKVSKTSLKQNNVDMDTTV